MSSIGADPRPDVAYPERVAIVGLGIDHLAQPKAALGIDSLVRLVRAYQVCEIALQRLVRAVAVAFDAASQRVQATATNGTQRRRSWPLCTLSTNVQIDRPGSRPVGSDQWSSLNKLPPVASLGARCQSCASRLRACQS